MLIQQAHCCSMCQAQQQVLGRAGVSTRGYTDLEKTINAQVFDPHAAWSGQRVKLPGQESREGKKVRASRRGEGQSSGCSLTEVGG